MVFWRKQTASWVFALVGAVGCGRVENTVYVGSSVDSVTDLPFCDESVEGQVFFVRDSESYLKCDGGLYRDVEVSDAWERRDGSEPSGNGGVGGWVVSGGRTGSGGSGEGGSATGGTASGGMMSGGSTSGGAPGTTDPYDPYEDGWIRWLGQLAERPMEPELGDAFQWITEEAVCVWDGNSWEVLAATMPDADCKEWEAEQLVALPEETRDVLTVSVAMDELGTAFLAWSGQGESPTWADYSYVTQRSLPGAWNDAVVLGEDSSNRSRVVAAPNGNALVLWEDTTFSGSPDRYRSFSGMSWNLAEEAPNLGYTVSGVPTVALSTGQAVATWNADDQVWVSTWSEGVGWSEAHEVGRSLDGGHAFSPAIVAGADGRHCVVWVNALSGGWDVYVNRYEPGGGWSGPIQVYEAVNVVRWPQAAYGPSGELALLWTDEIGATQPVFFSSAEPGGAFSTPQLLSASAEDATELGLAYTRAGEVIGFWDARGGINAVVKSVDGDWGPISKWGTLPRGPKIVPLGAEDALVTWVQGTTIQARRYNAELGWLTAEMLGTTRNVANHAVASDAKGHALIAWARNEGVGTRIYR